jgi:type IV pilus assembly protein PilM
MGVLNNAVEFFGLDVGTTAIRLVQLRHKAANPVLVTYNEVEVPDNVTSTDSSEDRARTSQLIRQLVKDSGVSTRNVVASLPASKVFASVITTPKLAAGDLATAVRYQADQYIPMALDQARLDWVVVGPGAKPEEQDVLLLATPNSLADRYLAIMEGAGLEIVGLETDGLALSRSMVHTNAAPALVLEIGTATSTIVAVLEGAPRLIRSVPVGGAIFARAVAQKLKLEEAQADQFIRKFGMTQNKLEGEVYKALKPSVDSLVSEVTNSVNFFAERYPKAKLEKIILTGGSSQPPELPAYLANSTNLPIEIGNPWTKVAYPSSQQDDLNAVANHYGVAVGLAMRGML